MGWVSKVRSKPGKDQTSAVLSVFAAPLSEPEFMSTIIDDVFRRR